MSHYTVTVVGPSNYDELQEALAPFNEDIEVKPYRQYDVWIPKDLRTKEPKEIAKELSKRWGEDEDYRYDPDKNAVYTISTYNPDSKWDWWTLGGRWQGSLPIKDGIEIKPNQIGGSGVFGNGSMYDRGVDMVQIKDIDFDFLVKEATEKANAEYDRWEIYLKALEVKDLGDPLLWISDLNTDHLNNKTASQLFKAYRELYHSDETVVLFKELVDSKPFGSDANSFYGLERSEYIERAAAKAKTLSFATLVDGEWIEPGKMGWWGMDSSTSDSKLEFQDWYAKMLSNQDPETWISIVDCHI